MNLSSLNKIVDFSSLEKLLGNHFIVFCGSAISMGLKNEKGEFFPFLPMVGTASEQFYTNVSNQLKAKTALEKILQHYVDEYVDGKFRSDRINRKFEDFIWRLEQALDEHKVADLLRSLYLCEGDQFLHNHVAIANLLCSSRVKLCITTNFDNAIELANPNIKIVVHNEKTVMKREPSESTILKLHGDVVEGSYVATTRELLIAERAKSFYYLEDLLVGKTVLVAGYSGVGDIDIAPHLRNSKKNGTKFVWLARPGAIPSDIPSDIATDWFCSDLRAYDGEKNWLVKLTGINYSPNERWVSPQWESRLASWFNSNLSSTDVHEIINSTLNVSGWAKFHIYYFDKWGTKNQHYQFYDDEDLLEFSRKCLGVGTYYSALQALRKVDKRNIKKLGLLNEYYYLVGFSNWRLAKLNEACHALSHFVFLDDTDIIGTEAENYLRVYLEVVRDILNSFNIKNKAVIYYHDHNIEQVCKKLISIASKSINPVAEILTSLVILDIERIIGKKVDIEEYRIIYKRAFDLQEWTFAKNAAHSILRMDLFDGIKRLRKLFKRAAGGWKWHSVKHNILGVVDTFPKYIINLWYFTNLVLSRIPVFVRELNLQISRIYWKFEHTRNIKS